MWNLIYNTQDFLAKLFGHTYRVRLMTEDGRFRNTSHYKGSAMAAVFWGSDYAKEKTEEEKTKWNLDEVVRVDR